MSCMKNVISLLVFGCIFITACEDRVSPQDNNTEPKPETAYTVDTEELYFAPRMKTLSFNLSNTSGRNITYSLYLDKNVGKYLEINTPGLSSDWSGSLETDKTKQITLEATHEIEGRVEGYLGIQGGNHNMWDKIRIPVIIETNWKDFYANVVGRVTDEDGNPIVGATVYYDDYFEDISAVTDEDGRYSIDQLPYISSFRMSATSKLYKRKLSDYYEYKPEEYEINFVLEPISNH